MQRQLSPASLAAQLPSSAPVPITTRIARALEALENGKPLRATAMLAAGRGEARRKDEWTRAYALIYAAAGDHRKADKWYSFALEHAPGDASLWAGKAMALQEQALFTDAIACYDKAIARNPLNATIHYNRGVALSAVGDLIAAAQAFQQALACTPDYDRARLAHANALLHTGRSAEALQQLQPLVQTPSTPEVLRLQGEILIALGRFEHALAAFDAYLGQMPACADVLLYRASALKELDQTAAALTSVDAALSLNPNARQARLVRANILEDLGRKTEAQEAYRELALENPMILGPAVDAKAKLRALFLFAPMGGNTPVHDMTSFADYDHDILMLMPGINYDSKALRQRTDVVFNLISDIDVSAAALADATVLIDRLARPTLNHPAAILETDRETVSRRLSGLSACIIPRVELYARDELTAWTSLAVGWQGPLIIRAAGKHGGDEMERVDDLVGLHAFIRASDAATFYLIQYVDYSSADGHFRKYRFMFVGDRILPYHLAIGRSWKVHHASTDMHAHPWMQAEEQAFLAAPEHHCGSRGYRALTAVRERFDLDYFGIDCGTDRNGNLVVFEVNASMLVHLNNERFPYKNPHVQAIKAAFADLLRQTATTKT